jgi:hypothetical protein
LTRPFQFISFDGKIVMYATKDCTEQLRNLHCISVIKTEKEVIEGVFVYTAYIRKANGQEDVGTGAVNIKGLSGKHLANAFKIAETQAKRRATLSICGLGWCDESEIPDVPNAVPVNVDFETGEIIKPEFVKPDQQQFIDEINNATCLDSLKSAYARAYVNHGGDEANMPELKVLKDKRKKEIEDLIQSMKDDIKDADINESIPNS